MDVHKTWTLCVVKSSHCVTQSWRRRGTSSFIYQLGVWLFISDLFTQFLHWPSWPLNSFATQECFIPYILLFGSCLELISRLELKLAFLLRLSTLLFHWKTASDKSQILSCQLLCSHLLFHFFWISYCFSDSDFVLILFYCSIHS